MLQLIAGFSLFFCVLNWIAFVLLTWKVDLKHIEALIRNLAHPSAGAGAGAVALSTVDASRLAAASGNLAGAFKKAGPAPTFAAISVISLIVALLAAGAQKLP